MFVNEIASKKQICDRYTELQNFQLKYDEIQDKTESKKIENSDDEKILAKLSFSQVFKEYFENLKEKLMILKLITQELGQQFVRYQFKYNNIQNVIENQSRALENIEFSNAKIECSVNGEIQKIRTDFLEKWKELDISRFQYNAIQKKLEGSCKRKNELLVQLETEKCELSRIMFALKSIRVGSTPCEFIDMKKFDALRRVSNDLIGKTRDTIKTNECILSKIWAVERELKLTRNFMKSQLVINKEFNEWSMEQLELQKAQLEMENSDCFEKSLQNEQTLRREIDIQSQYVAKAQNTVAQLKALINDLLQRDIPCKSVRPLESGKPKYPNYKADRRSHKDDKNLTVLGHDYLGSTIVKLKESADSDRVIELL